METYALKCAGNLSEGVGEVRSWSPRKDSQAAPVTPALPFSPAVTQTTYSTHSVLSKDSTSHNNSSFPTQKQ